MENKILQDKLAETEKNFEKVKKEIDVIAEQEDKLKRMKSEKNVELFRLQGEHRILTDLLKPPAPTEPEVKAEDKKL